MMLYHMQAHPSAHAAYFKSTDGHHGNWFFNLPRPNIHLLSVTASHGGYVVMTSLLFLCIKKRTKKKPSKNVSLCVFCSSRLILVDSTRAGKRIPDALSKTVPIWCAVINRAILLRGGCFVDRFEVPLPSPSSSSSDVARADTD